MPTNLLDQQKDPKMYLKCIPGIQGKDTVDFVTFNYLKSDECLGYFDMDFEIDNIYYKVYKFDLFP